MPAVAAYVALALGVAWLVTSVLQGLLLGVFGGWLVMSMSAVALWALRWIRGDRRPER